MKQAANLKNFKLPLLLPGITLNTSPTDYAPVEQAQLVQVQRQAVGAVRRSARQVGRAKAQ